MNANNKATTLLPFFFLVFSMLACGMDVDPATFSILDPVSLSTPTAAEIARQEQVVLPTQTEIPTPTIGYQETAIAAQQTANAAMELMVDATAAKERENFQQAAWTVTSEYMRYQNDLLTQAASGATASAYPTTIPLTQTQQAFVNNIRSTEQYMTVAAPTQIVAMAQSQTYAEHAEEIQFADTAVRVSISFFIFCLALFLLIRAIKLLLPLNPAAEPAGLDIPNFEEQPIIIPFKTERTAAGLIMRRAEIDCSTAQLLKFADGILNRRMTPAFNIWEGTSVHKNLKGIREFLIEHHFAKLVRGSGGALDIQAEGEAFLRECLESGNPPPPYQCIA